MQNCTLPAQEDDGLGFSGNQQERTGQLVGWHLTRKRRQWTRQLCIMYCSLFNYYYCRYIYKIFGTGFWLSLSLHSSFNPQSTISQRPENPTHTSSAAAYPLPMPYSANCFRAVANSNFNSMFSRSRKAARIAISSSLILRRSRDFFAAALFLRRRS